MGIMGKLITIDPLTPIDWGLPAKFTKWRPGQFQSIVASIDSPKRCNAKVKPTGAGKSLECITEHVMCGGRSLVLTMTKGLQDQYLDDFTSIGMVDVRGKQNYKCKQVDSAVTAGIYGEDEFYSCEEGAESKCPHAKSNACDHWAATQRAKTRDLVISNYHCYMLVHKHGDGWGKFDRLILDEAHDAPGAVADVMTVLVTNKDIQLIRSDWNLSPVDPFKSWQKWAASRLPLAVDLEAKLKEDIRQAPRPSRRLAKDRMRAKKLADKLKELVTAEGDWVVEADRNGMRFDPVWPFSKAEDLLFRGIPRLIPVSATLRPKTLKMLNILPADYTFTEGKSVFDPNRAPVRWIQTVRMDKNAGEFEKSMQALKCDQIVRPRADRKGIIHTHSYPRQEDLYSRAKTNAYWMDPKSGEVARAVAAYKRKPPPAVLISPAVTTGYDFPDDDCRYQIIVKIPFPDSRSKIIKARQKMDKEYGSYVAMQTLVQICGRGMRGPNDWCETFIIDDNAEWFMKVNRHLAPNWFWDYYQALGTGIIPPPLKFAPTERQIEQAIAAFGDDDDDDIPF